MEEKPKVSTEHIQQAIEQVFNQLHEDGKSRVKLTQYCKTYGTITRNSRDVFFNNSCQDVECINCQNFYKIMNEQVKLQLKKWDRIPLNKDNKLKL